MLVTPPPKGESAFGPLPNGACALVPPLPKGYIVREALISGIKAELLSRDHMSGERALARQQRGRCSEALKHRLSSGISVVGMGGSGKTVIRPQPLRNLRHYDATMHALLNGTS